MPSLSELYSASDSDPTQIVSFLEALAASYGLPQPLHVLDVGCGPGRLLLHLAKLHWQVTGMEPNPDFLAAAHEIAATSRRVAVQLGGFLEVDQRESFDLVIGINSSFAHLLLPTHRAEALHQIFDALRPGGVVFPDLPNFAWILKNYRPPEPYSFTLHGDLITLRRRHDLDFHRAIFTTTDEYVDSSDGHSVAGFVHAYGMATFPELEYFFDQAGLADLRTYNTYRSRSLLSI